MRGSLVRRLLRALLLISCALVLVERVAAQAPVEPGTQPDVAPAAASLVEPLVEAAPTVVDGKVSVLVYLSHAPAADAWLAAAAVAGVEGAAPGETQSAAVHATMAAAAQAQIAAVSAQQDALAGLVAQLGAVELYRAQRLYNAIALRVPQENVGTLRSLPGVAEVRYLLPKAPSQAVSIPYLGIPAIWQGAVDSPLHGEGIRVGLIDTGVDYLHVNFGGPGAGYEVNNTTVITDLPHFPGPKIVGGYDFVGETYNADPTDFTYQPVPKPDPDPMDCFGHGTHVAGTLAGYGVTATGNTYAGPFDQSAPFATMLIGPGVAPSADIYALKVFGCDGQSEVVDLALEWAVDPNGDGDFSDRLDVINMSLGSPLGSPLDSTAVASNKAAELGVFVVTSAGNSGAVHYVTGSPGVATRTLSVAATHLPSPISLFWPGSRADTLASFSSLGPRRVDSLLKPEIAAPGVRIVSALSGSGDGTAELSGTSMAAPHVAGAVAILRQQRPLASVEELKALLINTSAPVVRESDSYTSSLASPTRGGAGRLDLQAALRADVFAFNADLPGLVTLAYGAPEVVGSQTIVRNLRVVNRSAQTREYDLFYTPTSDQTDMAGVTVQILHAPTLTVAGGGVANVPVAVEAVAAEMVNSHIPAPEGFVVLPSFVEAESGYVWLWPRLAPWSALATGLKANPPGTSTVTALTTVIFTPTSGLLDWSLTLNNPGSEEVATIQVRRGPAGSADFAPAYILYDRALNPAPTLPITGSVTLSMADLPLLAGGYLQVAVTLEPSGEVIMGTLEPSRPVLKTPLHVAPRPASAMRAATTTVDFGAVDTAQEALPLTGSTLAAGGAPTRTVALLSTLELHVTSPRTPQQQDPPTPPRADIKYLGVTSNLLQTGNLISTTVSFAVVTFGRWSSPLEVLFNVYVDTDGDNQSNYIVFNGSPGVFPNDRFAVSVQNVKTGEISHHGPVNGFQRFAYAVPIFNADTMVFTVPAWALGLSPGKTSFSFFATSIVRITDEPSAGDQTAKASYDVARPGLVFSGPFISYPTLADTPGQNLQARINTVNYTRSSARGILLIHHHNANSARAEVVDVAYDWPYTYRFPIAFGP